MALDLSSQEMQLLLRQLEKGNAILFAGAGFSRGARNIRGEDPPLSRELAATLASECGWDYEDEDVGVVYEQAQKHLGTKGLVDVLNSLYRDCAPTEWHRLAADLFWFRIYTTNIDDVIENSYKGKPAQVLDRITCPANFEEQDIWFERVQCVHLHGSILEPQKGFTFTPSEYAGQTASPNPWYQALVDDMQSSSVIFIGTRLNEPPMYHYLALRSERNKGTPESRAKAFVVTEHITSIRNRQLQSQGFVVIEATAEEFLTTLHTETRKRVPDRLELLKARYPHQIAAINRGIFAKHAELLRQFELLSTEALPPSRRVAKREIFFEGAEPTWEDIVNGLDAPRGITQQLTEALTADLSGPNHYILVGHAGSGKSTTLRRVALELSRRGHTVYFCKSAQILEKGPVLDLITSMGDKHVFLFLDDAILHMEAVDDILRAAEDANVTFVLADRPHVVFPRIRSMRAIKPKLVEMPYLDKEDCESIISKLAEYGMLGELKGKSHFEQLRRFLARSRKQLLVAMKEATSGKGFDVIMGNEFSSLSGENARLAYTITCISYMHGAPVRRRHLLASIEGSDLERLNTIEYDLREVIVPWNDNDDLLCPRHRLIARKISTEISPPGLRLEAVTGFLTQLSSDITPENISRRTPEYLAYRSIINFDNLLDLFGEDYEVISAIYGELKTYYPNDYLFWLQFGRAEVYFDHFSVAENYLNQSLGIRQVGNFQALHNLGVLYLKRARQDENAASAEADAKRGEELLRQQIGERGEVDAYPYAALVTHKLRYLKARGSLKYNEQLEELVQLAEIGIRKYPYDEAMQEAQQEALREYLMIAVTENIRTHATTAE
jgi:hypothetical protein